MIQAIGLIVGAYCLARMIQIPLDFYADSRKADNAPSMGVIIMIVSIFAAFAIAIGLGAVIVADSRMGR